MSRLQAEKLFKPTESASQIKSANTDKTARSIIAMEVSERVAKTQKLREARLASLDETPIATPTK